MDALALYDPVGWAPALLDRQRVSPTDDIRLRRGTIRKQQGSMALVRWGDNDEQQWICAEHLCHAERLPELDPAY